MVPGQKGKVTTDENEAITFGYPRERMFESGPLSLWLSATGAVLNGG